MSRLYDASCRIDEKGRSNYFNNAKFILIILVVVGHMMSCIKDINYTAFQIDFFVYSFHMPAFILLSGYFSKKCATSWKKTMQHVVSYSATYVVAQIVFDAIQRLWLQSVTEPFHLFSPRVGLWYLLVLIVWTLLLHPLSKVPPKILFPILVSAGLLIGLWEGAGKEFALSRMVVFLPFFMGGFYMNQGFLDKLHELWFRVGSATVMGLLAMVCVSITSMEILEIFMGNQAYSVIGMSNVDGMTFRCLWYITSAFTVIAVLSLIPRGKIFFTHLGNRTMQVFILHSIICRIFFVTEAMDQLYESTNLFVIFGIAVAMVFLLSNHRLSKLVAWPKDLLYTIREKILA